jgi:hypothetical protein
MIRSEPFQAADPIVRGRAGRCRAVAGWLSLDSALATALYWGTVAAYTAAFLLVRFPPCVDYPQHLALATLLGRLLDPSAPEHAIYQADWLSYNGLFHVLTALLSKALPAEWAGKFVLSCIPPALGAAGLMLMRAAGRPPWYAALLLPLAYSFAMGWGFVNYCLAVPIALVTFTVWLRCLDGGRARWVVLGTLLVAYAHGVTLVALYLSLAIAFVARATPGELGVRRSLRAALRGGLPLLPAALYALVVFAHHTSAPHIGWAPEHDGQDVPGWSKLRGFLRLSAGNLGDHSDAVLMGGALTLVLALWIMRYLGRASTAPRSREFGALFGVWTLLYFVLPQTLFSTGFLFERVPVWIWAFALACAPIVTGAAARPFRVLALGIALLSGLNTARAFANLPDAGASAILERIPVGARVLQLNYRADAPPILERPIWVHLAAYHLARGRGEIAFDFTRYASLPVRLRDLGARPKLPSGGEWNPAAFRATEPYARYYDTLLVVAEPGVTLRELDPVNFGLDQPALLAEAGAFRLYRRVR